MSTERLKIGIDIDGVLADFRSAFHKRLEAAVGRPLSQSSDSEWLDVVPLSEFTRTLESLDAEFWASLLSLPGTNLLGALMKNHDCTFYTARSFPDAEVITRTWLSRYLLLEPPYQSGERPPIVVSASRTREDKVAKMGPVDVYIDDDIRVLQMVFYRFPQVNLFLVDALYNQAPLSLVAHMLPYRRVSNFDAFAAKYLYTDKAAPADDARIRHFDTGATRDTDAGKPRYAEFMSPLVTRRFGEYMIAHKTQSDGTHRSGDNWKKGIPKREYLESLFRHFVDVWLADEGYQGRGSEEDALCAIIFNTQGRLHELLKERTSCEPTMHSERAKYYYDESTESLRKCAK